MAKIETWMKMGGVALLAAALAAGCETSSMENEGTVSLNELQGIETTTATTGTTTNVATGGTDATGGDTGGDSGTTNTNSLWPSEITGSVRFLGTDVSNWAVTASLDASVSGGKVTLNYNKARVWPAVDGVNANPWVFVNLNGQWYAATWEYLRAGQTLKDMSGKSWGGHIKVSPLSSWEPRSGERIGLMVSGLVRGGLRNVQERSNVDMVTWR